MKHGIAKLSVLSALVALPLALVPAAPALAQSWPDWISFDGRLALGYTDRQPGADLFLYGDRTLRLDFSGFGPGLPLGLELGTFGRADALDTPHETYGALTWDFQGGGRLAVGVPRPAYDSFAVSALERHFPSLGVDRSASTRSEATFGAMFANYLPYGVRFQNQAGSVSYAASVHYSDPQGRTIASLGLSAPVGGWTFEAALESGTGGSSDISGKLQLHGTAGALSGGIGVYMPGATPGVELVEAFASYRIGDRLELSGVVQVPTSGGKTLGGVAARYGFGNGLAVSAGVVGEEGGSTAVSTFIDWSF